MAYQFTFTDRFQKRQGRFSGPALLLPGAAKGPGAALLAKLRDKIRNHHRHGRFTMNAHKRGKMTKKEQWLGNSRDFS